MSKAAQHLSSSGVGDSSCPDIRAQMARKAPPREVPIPEELLAGVPRSSVALKLCEQMRTLPRCAGHGCSGMRNEYLQALTRVPNREHAVKSTEWWANEWVRGTLPSWFVSTYMRTRIAPLVKGRPELGVVPDCRPVAVGECLRRLATTAVVRKFKRKLGTILWPQQVSTGIPSGAHILTTGVREILRMHPEFAVIKVDIENAYNACTRASMLNAVTQHETLAPLCAMYGATLSVASRMYMRGASGALEALGVAKEEGGDQGCASTGAAFALALHPAILAADASLAACGGGCRAFADDTYLFGPPQAVRDALRRFEMQVGEECGLRLNRSKSEFFIPALELAVTEGPAMVAAGLVEGRSGGHRGVLCVGIPVGTDAYVEHVARQKAATAKSKVSTILNQLLPSEPQAAQTMAYYCLSPLIDYLVQALPPRLARAVAVDFDVFLFQALVPRVLPAELATDDLLRRRLRLPARMCGGALRARGGWLCDAAYVAQLLRVLPMMTDHDPEEGGPDEPMVPGFAHDLLEPLLGVNLVKKADPFAVLLAGGSALAEEFEGSWREVQEAAGSPDEGPLSAPAAAAGVDLKNPDELPDPDRKRHEQHQLTELVEDILWVEVRRAFVRREQGDMTRMAVLNTNMFSTQWIHAWPNDQCKLDAESFHVTTSRYFGTPCPVASPYEGDMVHASQNGGVCDKYGRRLVTATLKGNPWKYKHDGWLAILLEQLRLAKADPQTNVFSLFARFFGREVRRRHEENPKSAWVSCLTCTSQRRRRARSSRRRRCSSSSSSTWAPCTTSRPPIRASRCQAGRPVRGGRTASSCTTPNAARAPRRSRAPTPWWARGGTRGAGAMTAPRTTRSGRPRRTSGPSRWCRSSWVTSTRRRKASSASSTRWRRRSAAAATASWGTSPRRGANGLRRHSSCACSASPRRGPTPTMSSWHGTQLAASVRRARGTARARAWPRRRPRRATRTTTARVRASSPTARARGRQQARTMRGRGRRRRMALGARATLTRGVPLATVGVLTGVRGLTVNIGCTADRRRCPLG